MQRRHFLKSALAFGSLSLSPIALFAQDSALEKPPIGNLGEVFEKGLSCYPDTMESRHQIYQLWVRNDNSVLTSYRAHPTQKYPYFYPVAGPKSGLSLTAESGSPWAHHRSLFLGLDKVNGCNFWYDSVSSGQIVSQGPTFAKREDGQFQIDATSAELTDLCFWKQPNKEPIIKDERRFVFHILDDKRYVIDAFFTFTALIDISIEQSNHGFFGIRTAPDLAPMGGGVMINADGNQGQANTHGKPSRWLAFYGTRCGLQEKIVEGIAVLRPTKTSHSEFDNCPWFTRDYGNCSPMPMDFFHKDKPMHLPKGDALQLRYRVVAFEGTPKDAGLDDLWTEFDGILKPV